MELARKIRWEVRLNVHVAIKKKTPKSRYALGVDIGGTFTDLVLLEREAGRVSTGKVLTDYDDLAATVIAGVDTLLAEKTVPGRSVESVVHGTTLVTNALIQRRGAATALLVTAGFPDVLEFARETRFDIFQLNIELPPPLIPRSLVFEVTERLDDRGSVVQALDEDKVRALAAELRGRGVEAAGVCLLHAYRNGVHERRIREIFAAEAPEIAISLSSEVMAEIREYERSNTVAANAFVQPEIRSYLERLASLLTERSIAAPLLLMTSDGGTISTETAVAHPIRLVESGPAGGAIAAAYVGAANRLGDVLAYDMGGTTAKICLIENGRPARSDTLEFGRVYRFARGSGLPLQVPAVDMIEIGAGGGSIAHVDEVGRLRVGPQSAGAAPGPACYGLGGTEPTVTDADHYLGYLGGESFLGGKMALQYDAAKAALDRLAKSLDLTTTRTAWGIHEVVNDNMARAAKIHCLERGKDPRDFTLVAYGGAGPLHAFGVASALGIRKIVYPLRAGVMSAFGFLLAPPSFEIARAEPTIVERLKPADVNRLVREMENEGKRLLKTAGIGPSQCVIRRECSVHFAGQKARISVPIPSGTLAQKDIGAIRTGFLKRYQQQFHRLNPTVAVEVATFRVVVSGAAKPLKLARTSNGRRPAAVKKGTRKIYLRDRDAFVTAPVYDRYALRAGFKFRGPAVIEEVESTVLLGAGTQAVVAPDGNLIVTL